MLPRVCRAAAGMGEEGRAGAGADSGCGLRGIGFGEPGGAGGAGRSLTFDLKNNLFVFGVRTEFLFSLFFLFLVSHKLKIFKLKISRSHSLT